MATLTIKQYIRKLQAQIKEIERTQRPLFIGASAAHAEMTDRIFVRGELSGGSQIGEYSSLYSRKRREKGRQSDFVDLKFTGRLNIDFANSLTRKRNAFVAGVKSQANIDKVKFIEKRYGSGIFKVSKKERKIFLNTMQREYTKIMRG